MKRILLIEDDPLVGNIYCNKFRTEGYVVEVARDGQAGKEMLDSFKPELVILDLMLPKITGIDLIKLIRARPELAALPVVVFSNSYLSSQIQEAWKAGATKCLSKSDCPPKQLIEIVGRILSPPAPAPTVAPVAAAAVPPVTPPPGLTATVDSSEAELQRELQRGFLQGTPQMVAMFRTLLHACTRSTDEAERIGKLQELSRQTRQLASNAGMVGFSQLSHLAAALEALVRELHDKPKHINPSTLRTLAQAMDLLGNMLEQGAAGESGDLVGTQTLVVDDDPLSRRATTLALDKAGLKHTSVGDPLLAVQLLSENQYDLAILDVEMPQMNGFELCAKLRTIPANAGIPAVFVTSHSDFESRAKSIMSGGNDLISKPFIFIELAVKALTHLLKYRLAKMSTARAAAPASV
jgi:CheY-like chemotaxis protein